MLASLTWQQDYLDEESISYVWKGWEYSPSETLYLIYGGRSVQSYTSRSETTPRCSLRLELGNFFTKILSYVDEGSGATGFPQGGPTTHKDGFVWHTVTKKENEFISENFRCPWSLGVTFPSLPHHFASYSVLGQCSDILFFHPWFGSLLEHGTHGSSSI